MPLCFKCGMWIPDGSQYCSACGTPAAEATQPPPPSPPSPPPRPLPFGTKLAISGAVVAIAAGATWLGVSPSSPLRERPKPPPPSVAIAPSSGPSSPAGGSVSAGGVTLSAEVVDEDIYIEDILKDIYAERGLAVPSDLKAPPLHAGRDLNLLVKVAPLPADAQDSTVSASVRGGLAIDCTLWANPVADWICSGKAPEIAGSHVIEIVAGGTVLEVPLEVLEPPRIGLEVDPLPPVAASTPVRLTGTISNLGRVQASIPWDGFSIPGHPECNPFDSWPEPGSWRMLLQGERRSWSCTVRSPDTIGAHSLTIAVSTDTGAAQLDFTLEVGTKSIVQALNDWWLGEYGDVGDATEDVAPAEHAAYWDTHLSPGHTPDTAYSIGADPIVVGLYGDPDAARAAFDAAADAAAAGVFDTTGSTNWCEWGYATFDRTQIGGHDAFVVSHTGKVTDASGAIGPPDVAGGWCSMSEAEIARGWAGVVDVVEVTVEDYAWVQGTALVAIPGVSAQGSHTSANWDGYWSLDPLAHERLFAELDPVLAQ